MRLAKLLLIMSLAVIFTGAAYAGAAWSDEDYLIKFVPTGEIIPLKGPLSVKTIGADVYMEYDNFRGQAYLASITYYDTNYVTNRGIMIGDHAAKVRECYGEPRMVSRQGKYTCLSYMDDLQVLKTHFFLDPTSEKVVAVNMNIYPVGTPPLLKGKGTTELP